MKHTFIASSVSVLAGVALVASTVAPAFAETPTASSTRADRQQERQVKMQANLSAKLQKEKARGDQEIARRIENLTKLQAKIQAMAHITADQKTALSSNIQAQITALNTLKAKIDADTDATTLQTDLKSVTQSYRIYALVIPQGAVLAAADRAETLVANMQTLSGKLQAYITQAQTAGKTVTALQTALTDYNAKVADASTQAQAAVTGVSALKPDHGDQTIFKANQQALKDARTKIQAANADLKAAQKDAQTIVKDLKEFKIGITASSTVKMMRGEGDMHASTTESDNENGQGSDH